MTGVQIFAVPGLPLVGPGDDLAALILTACASAGLDVRAGDIVCVAQKIVSKAEGRRVRLDTVTPSAEAIALAAETEKDPRMVELTLREATEVVRKKPGVLITRHRLGIVGANSGIDQSNIEHADGECALLLPEDPDASAQRLRDSIRARAGADVGVVITDSANRPWRLGTVGIAIGAAGLSLLADHRGGRDMFGRELKVTLINRADTVATAAVLVMGETTERTPVAIVRGVPLEVPEFGSGHSTRDLVRPLDEDLFR